MIIKYCFVVDATVDPTNTIYYFAIKIKDGNIYRFSQLFLNNLDRKINYMLLMLVGILVVPLHNFFNFDIQVF